MPVETERMFENKGKMLKRLKKQTYETYFAQFQTAYAKQLEEITAYAANALDKQAAAAEIGTWFTDGALRGFASGKKKIPSYVQADLNLFLIYYVFPALLKTGHPDAEQIVQGICAAWAKSFPGNKIGYTDYDTLYQSFHDKILGIF